MIASPRLALVTPANGPEPAVACLALLAGLKAAKWNVQHFRSWARPWGSALVGQVTGLPGRHLDAWLMPPDLCREVFARGAKGADLALVEGTLEPVNALPPVVGCPSPPSALDRPGPIGPIIEALDLPRLAVIDCRGWQGIHLPWIPHESDALLLDGLEDPEQFHAIRSMVGLLTGKPVVGAIAAMPEVRSMLAALPADGSVSADLIATLAESFLRFADLDAIALLAGSRPFPTDPVEVLPHGLAAAGRRFRVAYAMDEAFGGYFPDTLETLASLGAEMIEFSPLRDGSLPTGVDLVMIGCGCPDKHAATLAANHSLIGELRMHVCHGHRIYAEGGGTAYLGRTLIVDGATYPGAGIFPIESELQRVWPGPEPVERTLCRDVWLGRRGTVVRGYRSGRWSIHPAPDPDDCPARSGPLTEQRDMVFRKNAVGSLIHLHLGTLPQVVEAFAVHGRASVAPWGL